MVIESYDIQKSSQRTFTLIQSSSTRVTRELRTIQDANTQWEEEDRVSISDRVRGMHRQLRDQSQRVLAERTSAPPITRKRRNDWTPTNPTELRLKMLELMLEMLTGKKNLLRKQLPQESETNMRNLDFWGFNGGQNGANRGPTHIVERWSTEHFHFEQERVSYQAQGVIRTTDGRTINVDISMFVSREFMSNMSINVETQRPIDPLVINYGGTAASLLGDRFQFDLTMDGNMDSLPVLGPGSGFLAIDRNGDGKINDGSELFGPRTGCGFTELRKYDQDGNGWIDSGDEIFSKLVVWSRDRYGNDQIFTLKELGISAIYLGDIQTEFSFKDENNQTLGIMRSTSFFINENGGAGTLSHIDLMV